METYLVYIAKAAIAAGAFYIAFLLLFQNQKHFTFNRIYLPVSLALSFVIPLITFTTIKYIEPVTIPDSGSFAWLPAPIEVPQQPAFVFEWYHYLFGLYLLGTAGFLFHLLLGHLKAINIIQKSRIQKIFNNLVNITPKDIHPFSFFSKIVVSEKILSHPDLEMIVSHENIHVREKHTLDILFTEIMFLLQWFNPFAWLLKDAVKNNLEYITDNEIAKHYNPQTYQLAMVTLADKQGIAPFLTALNGSQLKNRIVMMKKKTENKYAVVKQLAVLPIMAILIMGLSNKEVKTEFVETETQPEIYNSSSKKYTIADIEISGIRYLDKSVLIQLTGLKLGQEIEVPGNAITTATKKLWEQGLFSDVKISASKIVDDNIWLDIYLKERPQLSGINFHGVSKSEEDDIKDKLSLLKGSQFTDKQVNDARQTIENIFLAKGFSNTEVDIVQHDDLNQSNSVILDIYVDKKAKDVVGFDYGSFKDVDPIGPPLYIVDGVEATNIDLIQPDNIESIDVLKNQSSTAVYGEKGKNGVVLITTKNKEKIEPAKVLGNKQVIGNINWINNEKYSSNELSNILGIKKGDEYSKEIIEERMYGKVSDLYMDNGYLFFNISINEKQKENNVVDLDFTIFEGTRWKVGKVEIKGKSDGLANEILIKSGDLFSRSKLNQSVRLLGMKIKEDSEVIDVDVKPRNENPNQEFNIVDLAFMIKEKNGEIVTSLKNDEPMNETYLALRKSIAQNIKYPVIAQENNQQGVVEIWAFIAKDGTISRITDKRPDGKFINVDEVVVTSYKSEKAVTSEKSNDLALLVKESKRVIEKLSPLTIPELADKTVSFRIRFVLQ